MPGMVDRKSTRLNSSHLVISYAVFCLKKKEALRRGLLVGGPLHDGKLERAAQPRADRYDITCLHTLSMAAARCPEEIMYFFFKKRPRAGFLLSSPQTLSPP